MKRIVTIIVIGCVLGAGGFFAYRRYSGDDAETVRYQTKALERGDVMATVTATGTLSPVNTVKVGSQVSGRILELFADFNSQVTAGQVIARIDPRIFESNVSRAKANLAAERANLVKAQAVLEDARLTFERASSLAQQKLVAQADVDSASAAFKSAKAQEAVAFATLAQSRAALDQAEVNLAYTTIVSPIDGTVISRDVDVGQTVAASLQAPTLFTIAEDLSRMELHTSVAESDIGRIQPEMRVSFTVDAFPDKRFRGVVQQIRNSPETVQNVVTYDAVVRVDNDQLELRPGMTANVTFIAARRRDVLLAPNTALRFSPPDEVLALMSEQERALVESTRSRDRGAGRGRGNGNGPRDSAKPTSEPGPKPGAEPTTEPTTKPGDKPETGDERPARDTSVRVLWIMDTGAPAGTSARPRPVLVKVGITDGTVTEVLEGEVTEGTLVVIGTSGGKSRAAGGGQSGGARRGRFL